MNYPMTRVLAAASAGYGVYCLARPDALAKALGEAPNAASRRISYMYAARDIPLSALAIAAPAAWLATTTGLRVAADLTDAAVLAPTTAGRTRTKVLAVTLGWAAINAVVYLGERGRAQ